MPYEEDQLAKIAQATIEMDANETARHTGYVSEDEQTAIRRQKEDDLHAEGVKSRDALKASIEAAIKKRDAQEAAMSPDAIEALLARIAALEASEKAKAESAPAA